MKRREFITLLQCGGVAARSACAAAFEAPHHRDPRLGHALKLGAMDHGFVRLRELVWIEGRNVAIEVRWGEGRNERFAEIAAEFVRRKSMSSSREEMQPSR